MFMTLHSTKANSNKPLSCGIGSFLNSSRSEHLLQRSVYAVLIAAGALLLEKQWLDSHATETH